MVKAFMLLAFICIPDLDVTVTDATVQETKVTTTKTQLMMNGEPVGSELTTKSDPVVSEGTPAKIITVQHDAPLEEIVIKVEVKRDGKISILPPVSPFTYTLAGVGTYKIRVDTFYRKDFSGWEIKEKTIVIGNPDEPDQPDEPDTPDPDLPDVPTDSFDNIGQRVAKWAVGLPQNKEVGTIYLTASKRLSDPQYTAGQIMPLANEELAKLKDIAKYDELRKNVGADLIERWGGGFNNSTYAKYFKALAAGLGVSDDN